MLICTHPTGFALPVSVLFQRTRRPDSQEGRRGFPWGPALKGAQITGVTAALGSLLSLHCARVLR